jgi:biopolymer transport protein ExbD
MGMSVGSGGGDGAPMMEMNTTPLIDVMLVLIIMLIVTLPVMTHAVKLDMPRPDSAPPPVQPEVVTIIIDYDGTILWNDTPVENLATLERYFKSEAQKLPQPQVAIRPDARARYDVVAQVLASAQRNRIEKMGLIGNEQFE